MFFKKPVYQFDAFAQFLILGLFIFLFVITGVLLSQLLMYYVFGINFFVEGIDNFQELIEQPNANRVFQGVGHFFTFTIPAVLFLSIYHPKKLSILSHQKLSLKAVFAAVVFVTIIGPLVYLLAEWNKSIPLPENLKELFLGFQDQSESILESFLKMDYLGVFYANLLVMAILPAVGEELLFRGVLQRLFNEWFKNIHVAIIVTGILFGMIHFQFYNFLPIAFLGILLGYLYVYSGNIWIPILAHFVFNGSTLLAAYTNPDYNPESLGQVDWWIYLATAALLTMIGFVFYKIYKSWRKEKQNFSSIETFIHENNFLDNFEKETIEQESESKEWIAIWSTDQMYQAELVKSVLAENDIEAIIINKKDSAYQTFGRIEIHVPKEISKTADAVITSIDF